MTKLEREGLQFLGMVGKEAVSSGSLTVKRDPSVRAALDWIQRQIALDEKRRRKRGNYKKR